MNANHELERRIADFYASEAPPRAPAWVLGAALATIETTQQRRAFSRVLRRFTSMTTTMKVVAAAVVVIATAVLGLAVIRPGQGPGVAGPSASPTPSPSPAASRQPGSSAYEPPELTESFTSQTHGITLSYPAGWMVRRATEPWATPVAFNFGDPVGDVLYDPGRTDHLHLRFASQPLAGVSPDAWAASVLAADDCGPTEPVVVDGASGVIAECGIALVSIAGRGYLIALHLSPDDSDLRDVDKLAWLDQILATVQLNPDDAVARRADAFVRPFSYVLPADPEFDLGTSNGTFHEVRVPEWNDAGHGGGLIVQAVGGGRVDPCNATSAPLALDAGPDAVISYLKAIPELTISDESSTTVDGRPARQATVLAGPATTTCSDLWVWADDTEPFIRELALRVVAVEVDGEHIVITIFGEPDNPGWPALADELIASFRFGEVAPSVTPSP